MIPHIVFAAFGLLLSVLVISVCAYLIYTALKQLPAAKAEAAEGLVGIGGGRAEPATLNNGMGQFWAQDKVVDGLQKQSDELIDERYALIKILTSPGDRSEAELTAKRKRFDELRKEHTELSRRQAVELGKLHALTGAMTKRS